ncbi:hypothetical protein COBT_001813, partial [Conglomerata obtusa]
MFIQIDFEEEGNRQNYYLFLPTLSLKVHHFIDFFEKHHFYKKEDLKEFINNFKDRVTFEDLFEKHHFYNEEDFKELKNSKYRVTFEDLNEKHRFYEIE